MAVRNYYVTEIIDLKKYINIHNLMAGIRNKVIPTVSHLKLLEIYSELDLFREFLKKYDLSDIECKNIWVPLETDKFELMITNIFDDSKSFRNKGFSDTLIEFHKFLGEQ